MNASNITSTNFSTYTYCKYWEPDNGDLKKTVKYIAVLFLCALGILNNIFIVVLAVKYTVRKNLHHLIINMATSDALYLTIQLWYKVSSKYHIQSYYPVGFWGDMLCKITILVADTSYKVSLVTLLVISIERFKATRQTLQRSRPYTIKQRVTVVGICWLIPMLVSGYSCYFLNFDATLKVCYPTLSWQMFRDYSAVVYLLNTLVLIIISALSIISIRRLSRTQAIQAHLNEEQIRVRSRRTRSAVLMVLASALLYACCWFPTYFVTSFILLYDFEDCFDWATFQFVIDNILPALNAGFSPFIYIIFLPDFRKATKRVLCFRKVQEAPREEISFSTRHTTPTNTRNTNQPKQQ